jgi:hypothetical protein
MRNSNLVSLFLNAVIALVLVVTVASCEEDPCEDAICGACPSSRLILEYQDSTGACVPSFHSNAVVKGIDMLTGDTTLTYNLSDSCVAGLLVRENYQYVISSGTYRDVIDIVSFNRQDPVEVTECCLCYPVSSLEYARNGDTAVVDYPTGQYDNDPVIVPLN